MYARMISVLFYMFFTCVIFNPQVSGVTLYIYVLIPFLDPGFLRFVGSTFRKWSTPLGIAVLVSLMGSPSVAVRVLSIAACVGYLLYTSERGLDCLHQWMTINVLFALVQFVLFYVDYDLSIQLGPNNLSKMLWGDYATDSNTNFYEIFYFSRVAGFSREAGFFSSLLVASFVADVVRGTASRKMILMYCIGLFISFSKSSFVFLIFAALYPMRKRIRTVHPLVVLIAFIACLTLVAVYLARFNFFYSDTFGHRLGGYAFMFDARLEDIVGGINAHDLIANYRYLPYVHLIERDIQGAGVTFAGLPANVAEMGLFSALILFGVIAFTASDGFVILLFLLLTATVSVTTVTSFVPLAYLICYWPRFAAYSAKRRAAERPPPRLWPYGAASRGISRQNMPQTE
ncbi:hypothetical protein [Paraburkholderia sp. PGU16]|uniref:O-antigen polymerase n=1 Tax=Paraburkholderia largidicola TaxID=3014751 RepID=A0A7I8BW50_9BURK|nr:hypothetical protein [Paraburkholderia sp. PGU16]BCF92882.1 hypothetical protein PPGU16_59490 [Paraburkholderia sp. PGU16]BEU26052.1 hypothetical protein PBP221_61920 [Paraburkholderia sp. 22B1P]GJH33385.1 hypothetical protein CBA19CS91_11530 [Paraburkholderia hospita]